MLSTISTSLTGTGVGFIGLGIMGEGMAARLLSEGVAGGPNQHRPLVIWNRTPSKCLALKELFPDKDIQIKATAREAIESCGITYSMLSTPEAAKDVFEGPNGVLAGISAGKKLVDCATLAESDMERMSAAVTRAGGIFLEAPVVGSKIPAATGQLVFLCAGSQTLFEEAKDHGLSAMGKASHFFGEQVGHGTRAKLVINSLMGTLLTALGEGLALSQAVGLDSTVMMGLIAQGVCGSPLYAIKGPKMLAGDHATNFPLRHMAKDMTLAKDMAAAAGVEYSVMNQAETMFRMATDDTDLMLADQDFSAIIEMVHKQSANVCSQDGMTLAKKE